MTFETIQLVLFLIACGSAIGSLVMMVVLIRCLADISLNVHRMTSWTSRILALHDDRYKTHGRSCGNGRFAPGSTCQVTGTLTLGDRG